MTDPENVVRAGAVEWVERSGPPTGFGGRVQALGRRLPLVSLGVSRVELPPGRSGCPLHEHRFEEECFYLLEGALTVDERTPDGTRRRYRLRPGELVAYPPGTGVAHRFTAAGGSPARFLALSDRHEGDVCVYPDSDKVLLRDSGLLGVFHGRSPGAAATPPEPPERRFAAARARRDREPGTSLPDEARPGHVAGLDRSERELGEGERRFFGTPLSRAAGATVVYVNRDRLPPGSRPSDLHRHAFDEELLYVLSGRLRLRQVDDGGEVVTALGPGDLVHWAPGGVAHELRNDGADDAVYLAIGTDRPWDVIELPERGERYVAALGQVGTFTETGYWDGEGEG